MKPIVLEDGDEKHTYRVMAFILVVSLGPAILVAKKNDHDLLGGAIGIFFSLVFVAAMYWAIRPLPRVELRYEEVLVGKTSYCWTELVGFDDSSEFQVVLHHKSGRKITAPTSKALRKAVIDCLESHLPRTN